MNKAKRVRGLLFLPLLLSGLSFLTGCGNKAKVDYVHDGSVQLGLNYHNTDFYTQGIVQVELAPKGAIDGDTAHFFPKTGSKQGRLKARFYGVDTPESTGSIEPYGFDASDFTKAKLNAANENGTIVVSSPSETYTRPSPDSTGSRYVLMVWINETKKDAPLNELYSLNLWLVQEGLSLAKGLDDMPQYKDTFAKAEAQARDLKLKIFSGQPDPRYNYGEYLDISLLNLAHEIQEGLDDPDYEYSFDNAKVHIFGTVGGFSNGTLFLQNFYSEREGSAKEDGEYVGVNIYTGMGGIPTRFKEQGAYIEIYGIAKYSQFGFQISDTYFPTSSKDKSANACKVILPAKDNTVPANTYDEYGNKLGHQLKIFEMTANELTTMIDGGDRSLLFSPVTITDIVECVRDGSYVSDKNWASLRFKNQSFAMYCAFQYKPYPGDPDRDVETWTELDQFVGKHFRINQCVLGYHEDFKGNLSVQFCPTNSYNFTYVDVQ